jgi:hypothetical protein
MLLPSQYRVAVLVKGNNGAGYIELYGIVRARNLIWCGSDDPHGQVDVRFKQRQTRADLTLASDGHAEAERRSRVMPNPHGSQKGLLLNNREDGIASVHVYAVAPELVAANGEGQAPASISPAADAGPASGGI